MRHWALSGAAWVAAVMAHRVWSEAPPGTLRRGLSDAASHAALALATTLPLASRAPTPARVLAGALVGALAIDLDHVVAARSLRLRTCMTMPSRPPTHSVVTAGLLVGWAFRWDRPFGLGVGLGLGSHLVRDLATGGAPLFHPARIVTLPERWAFPLALGLGAVGWWLSGRLPNAQS